MKKPKVIFCYNDTIWHKGSNKSVFWAQKLEEDGFEVERIGSTEPLFDKKLLSEIDLLVMSWSEDHITREMALNLCDAVGFDGLGLAGYHETSTAFRQYHWHWMFGSFMATHPGYVKNRWQHKYTVHVTNPDDPIMRGITDFEHCSEQFYLFHDGDNLNEVLADTTMTESDYPWMVGCKSPVAYKRQWGKGKIFYSTLGHSVEEFECENVYKIQHRGMVWASKTLPEGVTIETLD